MTAKTVLITGASSGIGEACARRFAEQGHSLILTGRRLERLEALAAELRGDKRIEVTALSMDVSKRESIQSMLKTHACLLEKVDVALINAGLARGLDPLHEAQAEDWEEMIDTNVKGALWTTELVLPFFRRRDTGHIVFMGSVAARWMYPKGNVYSATKAAVHALAESLRLDLLGSGIRVTTIAPGLVETEFSNVRFNGDVERAKSVYRGLEPLSGDDVADAVAWACSRPAHVNIQEIVMYPTAQASPSQVARKP